MYKDMHIHCEYETDGDELLRLMDKVEMEKAILISPHTHSNNEEAFESINVISRICVKDPSRLIGFAWIEPSLSESVNHVDYAFNSKKLRGVKMMPDHWYPYEERIFPVYKKIEELRQPILFHSGILYANMDSSRFCRPCFYEVMLHFPKIKFALAHISWPWTDECIATFGRMRSFSQKNNVALQMYIDITQGTPRFYRTDAMDKAIKFAGPERLIFGSDDTIPSDLSKSLEKITSDKDLITKELALGESVFRKISYENFEEFLKPIQ